MIFHLPLLGAAPAWLAGTQSLLAEAWPNMDQPFVRGPGYYLSLPKILLCWLLFLLWVRTTDLVSQDCQRLKLSYALWNSVVFFTFVAAFILLWLLPWFGLGFFLMLLAYAVPLAAYVWFRNQSVSAERRILTPDYFRHFLSQRKRAIGMKVSDEPKAAKREGPPVNFTAQGGKTDRDNAANLLLARQSPGFPLARQLLADAFDHRAEGIALDYTEQSVAVRYQIDGVWHNHEPRDRASGDVMLAVLKTIAALNVNERRARQEGTFAAEFKGLKYNCRIASQAAQTGERVILQMADPAAAAKKWTFEELGLRNKLEEQLKGLLGQSKGVVLFASPPAGGLTTTIGTAVRAIDRFLRDTVAVEEAAHREPEVDNVPVTTYNAAAGESPFTVLPKMARTYPNVYVVRDLVDLETIEFLCEQVGEDRLVVSGIRAKESAEALLRVLLMKIPATKFAPVALGVLSQRFIRKLCDKCKEAYAPTPEMLKQMGLSPGKVQALYRPPQPQPDQKPPPPCPDCLGLGYKGRTALFELLVVNDGVREALIKTPKLDVVRDTARKAGMRTMQEEGILLVAKGVTSVAELARVMKS